MMNQRAAIKRLVKCVHKHVSGRRCGQLIAASKLQRSCVLHRGQACAECDAMKRAFEPSKGW